MVIAVQVISVISLIMCIFPKSSFSILINCDAHLMVFIHSFILVINYKKLYGKNYMEKIWFLVYPEFFELLVEAALHLRVVNLKY